MSRCSNVVQCYVSTYRQRSLEQLAMYEYGLTNSWQDWNGSFSRVAQTSSTFCSEESESLFTRCIMVNEALVGVGQEYTVCMCVFVCSTNKTRGSSMAHGDGKREGTTGHLPSCGSSSAQLFPNIAKSCVKTPVKNSDECI